MSHKDLHNPHLKENPFTVPEGYFEEVQARWSRFTAQAEEPALHTKAAQKALFGSAPAEKARTDATPASREKAALVDSASKYKRLRTLLLPQLQLAAAFALLFGLGYLFVVTLTRNKLDTPPADELYVLNELSSWGFDHHTLYQWVQEGVPEDNNARFPMDLDIEELLDYMDYPGFDPVYVDLNTLYDIRHLP